MFIKRIISLCIFLAFTSPLHAVDLGDFTKDIEKQVTDKIKDGLSGTETDQNITNDNPVQNKSTQNSDSTDNKNSSKNDGDYVVIHTSKYLSIDAFQKYFKNKVLTLDKTREQNKLKTTNDPYMVFKVVSGVLSDGSNYKENTVPTEFFYQQDENSNYVMENLAVNYYNDIHVCHHLAKQECSSGVMAMWINAFDFPFIIIHTGANTVGSQVLSKEGFKLVPAYVVNEGDVSYNPNEFRVRSYKDETMFSVRGILSDDSLIKELKEKTKECEVNPYHMDPGQPYCKE